MNNFLKVLYLLLFCEIRKSNDKLLIGATISRISINEIYGLFPTDKVLLSEWIQASEEGSYLELYMLFLSCQRRYHGMVLCCAVQLRVFLVFILTNQTRLSCNNCNIYHSTNQQPTLTAAFLSDELAWPDLPLADWVMDMLLIYIGSNLVFSVCNQPAVVSRQDVTDCHLVIGDNHYV